VLVLDGEKLPGGLKVVYLPGSADSEVAFYARQSGGIVMMGDALLHLPNKKGLALLPEQYCEDKKLARQSLKKLLELDFKTVTFAHGEPLVDNAKKQITDFLKKNK
jgi:glyoxylase-like metal-dependent hydrolase (beta-lactamase superfamily II)